MLQEKIILFANLRSLPTSVLFHPVIVSLQILNRQTRETKLDVL